MDYFLDSNVIIGYIFNFDSINRNVVKFIEFKNNYYYSDNVQNEIEKVYKNKNRQYGMFLLMIWNFLNSLSDNDLIDEYKVHDSINSYNTVIGIKQNDMHLALNIIWNLLSLDGFHDVFEIKSIFEDFLNNFQSRHSFRKDHILNNMILVPNHARKDKQILEKIDEFHLRDELLHRNDEKILFDANEFCKNNKGLNLKFVTADQDFFKVIDILMDNLCFDECINLIEFTNN